MTMPVGSSWLHLPPISEEEAQATRGAAIVATGLYRWAVVRQSELTQDEWCLLYEASHAGETQGEWLRLLRYSRRCGEKVYAPEGEGASQPTAFVLRRVIQAYLMNTSMLTELRDACYVLERAVQYGDEVTKEYVQQWLSRIRPVKEVDL